MRQDRRSLHGLRGERGLTVAVPGLRKVTRVAAIARRRLRPRPVVLMYHRVATPPSDPWDIAVTPVHFAEHMEVLAATGAVVPLEEIVRGLGDGGGPARIAVTFDDGYGDVLDRAVPVMERLGIPATVFVIAKGARGEGARVWWDAVAGALLHRHPLPERLVLEVGGARLEWPVPGAGAEDLGRWRAEPVRRRDRRPPPPRAALYLAVFRELARLDDGARDRAAAAVLAWAQAAGAPVALDEDQRLVGPAGLRQLAGRALVTVGAHSVTHPYLSGLDAAARWREIRGGRELLEQTLGQEVLDFSFPGGDAPPEAFDEVRRAGYRAACTSRSADVEPGCDVHAIPRLIVRDMDGRAFARWLWTWGHG